MIIEYIKNKGKYSNIVDNYEMHVPDQFVTEKDKESPDWIKSTMDYYYAISYSQYWSNNVLKKNYDLVNGILVKEDYFTPDYEKLVEFLDEDISVELPDYVKHYPMINPPLNVLIGEVNERPDNVRFKAVDDYSYNEYMTAKTELLQEIYLRRIDDIMFAKASKAGLIDQKISLQQRLQDLQNPNNQQVEQQMEVEQIEQQIQQLQQEIQNIDQEIQSLRPKELEAVQKYSFQTVAEQWANLKLEQLKLHFDIKHKSQEAFRDFLTTAREFHHIHVDKSKMGIGYEVLNPIKTWFLTEPDPTFTTDCYAIGYIDSMELSRIIDKFDLSEEEINWLKDHKDDYVSNPRADGNIFETGVYGFDSVQYPQHNPLRTQNEALFRAELEQQQLLETYDVDGSRYSPAGYLGYDTRNQRYTVVTAYFKSKRKVGKLSYLDDDGFEQVEIVDEHFEYDKKDPSVKIDWEYINVWYYGYRIGRSIYGMKPLYYTELPPIIGTFFRAKNTIPKSMVDQMKVFQIIYNICLNQLYLLLEKEVGVAVLYNLRQLPRYKDMTEENALEKMVTLAKESGIVPIDDSPENMKGQSSFNQFTKLDLTRTAEIQSRISLAGWAKQECWSLLGFSPQRLGGVAAQETATGIQASMTQSFSQTEHIVTAHEKCMNLVYQQLIDTAKYVESEKQYSVISYVNSELHDVFLQVPGEDLKTRDLQVFVTDRSEDKAKLDEIRKLSLAYAQNQLHPYYTAVINTSNSVSEIKQFLKGDMEKKEEQQAEQQKMQQQQMEQQKQIADQQAQLQKQIADEKIAFDTEQRDLDRKKDIAVAQIRSLSSAKNQDVNMNTVPDTLEIGKFNQDYTKIMEELDIKQSELNQKRTQSERDYSIKQEELRLKNKEIESREKIEQMKSQTAMKNPVAGEKKK